MFNVLRSLEGVWRASSRLALTADGVEGEAGGGEGAGGGSSHQPVEGEQGSGGQRGTGDTGGQGQMIPKSRFDEVNNLLKQFKQHGTPEEIAQLKERVKWMQDNPGKRYNEKELQEIERELLQVPRMAAAVQNADRFAKYMERQSRTYVAEGNRRTEKFLSDMGREPNEKNKIALTNALSGIISSDEDLMERFLGFDTSVFEEAFKVFKSGLIGDVKNIPGAGLQAKKLAPKASGVKPQAPPQKAQNNEPKTEREQLDEAGDMAFDVLLSHGE
jgi:hypothetical protein